MLLEVAWLCLRLALAIVLGYLLYDQTESPALLVALVLIYGRSEAVHAWQRYWELMEDSRKTHLARIKRKWEDDMKKHTRGPGNGCTV